MRLFPLFVPAPPPSVELAEASGTARWIQRGRREKSTKDVLSEIGAKLAEEDRLDAAADEMAVYLGLAGPRRMWPF